MNYSNENALITGLFFDDPSGGTRTDEAAGLLNPEDFQDEGCRNVFRAMVELRIQNLPIDLQSVAEALFKSDRSHESIPTWLADSSNGSPLIYGEWVKRYAGKIKAEARARQLTHAIGLAGEKVQSGEDIGAVKARLVSDIESIESEQKLSHDKPLGDTVVTALNAMAARLSGDDSQRGLKTGINQLDASTGGLNAGEFWICGAMPGRGKTAFALQVAEGLASEYTPILFVSMEMSSSAIFRRLLKMRFGSAVTENPSQAQWSSIVEYSAELKKMPFYINESASLEASEIAQHARMMIARQKIRLVIVDYLQIVRGPGRDRRERTGDAANVLRSLAKDSGVPVLALSQLRRPDSLNDRPSMIELKESGDLEAHANVVLLMHMPTGEDGSFTGEEEIIIGKQREGPLGSIPVWFDRSRVRFRERTRQ